MRSPALPRLAHSVGLAPFCCLTFAPTRGRARLLIEVRRFSPVAVRRAVRAHVGCNAEWRVAHRRIRAGMAVWPDSISLATPSDTHIHCLSSQRGGPDVASDSVLSYPCTG